MHSPSQPRYVLARPPCEWCSAPYRTVVATVEVETGIGEELIDRHIITATARLCADCAGNFTGPRRDLIPVADAHPLLTGAAADFYVAAEFWTEARSAAADDPHQYLLLRVSHDPLTHLRLIRFIRCAGERRQWPRDRRWYFYWRSGGYEYWPMGEHETLLNRRVIT